MRFILFIYFIKLKNSVKILHDKMERCAAMTNRLTPFSCLHGYVSIQNNTTFDLSMSAIWGNRKFTFKTRPMRIPLMIFFPDFFLSNNIIPSLSKAKNKIWFVSHSLLWQNWNYGWVNSDLFLAIWEWVWYRWYREKSRQFTWNWEFSATTNFNSF
jgi:hypothetical protein